MAVDLDEILNNIRNTEASITNNANSGASSQPDLDDTLNRIRAGEDIMASPSKSDGLLSAGYAGLKSGIGSLMSDATKAIQEVGRPRYKSLEQWASEQTGLIKGAIKTGEDIQAANEKQYEPYSKEWWTYNAGAMAPTMVGLGLTTAGALRTGNQEALRQGARYAAGRLGAGSKLAELAGEVAPAGTIGVASTYPEASLEGQNAYDDAVKEGRTSEEAGEIRDAVTKANMALLSGTNTAEILLGFSKLPFKLPKSTIAKFGARAARIGARAARIGSAGAVEAGEEATQQIIPKAVKGEKWSLADDDVRQAAALGGAAGLLFGGLGAVSRGLAGKQQSSNAASAADTNAADYAIFGNAILQTGEQQLGKPYSLGSDGVDATDCGLFTQQVFAQQGIDLGTRVADGQFRNLEVQGKTFTDESQLKPGDLVFWDVPGNRDTWAPSDDPNSVNSNGQAYKGITHVGIYAGDGKALQAGSSGVGYMDINQYPIAGFGRAADGQTPVGGSTPSIGVSSEQIQAFNDNISKQQLTALKQLAQQRAAVSDDPGEVSFLDEQLKRGTPGLLEIAQQYGMIDGLTVPQQPVTDIQEVPKAQDGLVVNQTPTAQTAEAQDFLNIVNQSEPQAEEPPAVQPGKTIEEAQAADREAIEGNVSTVGALRYQAAKMPDQTLLNAADSFLKQKKPDHLNTVVNELVNRGILPPAAKEGVLDTEMLQIAKDTINRQALKQQAADIGAIREQGQQLTNTVNALAAQKFDEAGKQFETQPTALQPQPLGRLQGLTGRKALQSTAVDEPQPEVKSPDFKPNSSLGVGSIVYHPKSGAPLEITDVGDPGMFTVKTPNGTTFNIGRSAVLTENPKAEAKQPFRPIEESTPPAEPPTEVADEAVGSQISNIKQPAEDGLILPKDGVQVGNVEDSEPAQQPLDLSGVRAAYVSIAKELFNGQTHSRAVGLKPLQQRLKMPNADFVNLISEIQKANIPGVELGFARNQDKAVRVNTPIGEQRYSSITFHPSDVEQINQEPTVVEPATEGVKQVTPSDVDLRYNKEKNGIELRFKGKPPQESIGRLKAAKFRYSPKQRMWYGPNTPERDAAAKGIAGLSEVREEQKVEKPEEKPKPEKPIAEQEEVIVKSEQEDKSPFEERTREVIDGNEVDVVQEKDGWKVRTADTGKLSAVSGYSKSDAMRQATKKLQRDSASKQEAEPVEEKEISQEPIDKSADKEYPKAVNTVSDWVLSRLNSGKKFTSDELFEQADKAFNGTQAENKYTSKDAYDALELGVNKYILSKEQFDPSTASSAADAKNAIESIKREILTMIPTQTKRTAEMDEFQQFSTPPHIAYTAAWVSNVSKNDTVVEPSAGIGGIASFAKATGAKVIVNELSERRASIIRELPFDRVFTENAEQINNILPADVKPTAVLMNPPFSSTAGRVQGERKTVNATSHIEQALKRLQPNGRLVTIVGRGMADNAASFQSWWKKIKSEYNVRANIGIDGKDYTKYGTGFDVQIIVIDKTGKTEQPTITGNVSSAEEALPLLEAIRDDRNTTADRLDEQAPNKPGSEEVSAEGRGDSGPDRRVISVSTDRVGDRERISGERESGNEQRPVSSRETSVEDKPTKINEVSPDSGMRRQSVSDDTEQPESARDTGGRSGIPSGSTSYTNGRITVEQVDNSSKETELSDSTFDVYYPQKLKVPGAKKHPTPLVQSAAMAAVEPPAPTYSPNLPKNIITDGTLSIAQLEAIVYAGQSFEQTLPDGTRKGYFIGDGTGLGKGREIAGVILDSFRGGKSKAVWVTKNDPLYSDAVRDWTAVGGKKEQLFKLGKFKLNDTVTQQNGVMFVPYGTLSSNLETSNNGDVVAKKGKKSRIDQITEWLGKDFDGVIAFDEAHKMANSVPTEGKRGKKKASATGLSGIELQKRFPNARIMYVSATGATEVGNLAYASRLGLWGEGTAFANVNDFISQIDEAGLAAMELIARDMKSMGVYIARNLSYDGVTYGTITHELNSDQQEIYDTMARGWQTVLQNINKALEAIGAVDDKGKVKNKDAKKNAMGQFWGAQQRFFNQILTSMQMPAVIEDVKKQIKAGNAVVMQLVNTNEATQNRKISEMAEDQPIEDLDLTPKDILLQFLDKSFPIQQFEEFMDDEGNKRSRPVVDSKGNPVENAEAVVMKNELMSKLGAMKVPDGPLEIIINTFGTKNVAEVTGRQRRAVKEKNEDSGRIEGRIERRSPSHNAADVKAFLGDKKSILVFSDAGGTGQSFHAGTDMKNQRRRIHYLIQPGWRADNAVQGFGRTHRSGEVSQPHYTLVTTNLKGQKRFISTIARRLDQLGALTKGQRDAANQGLFSAKDNLESQYARDALQKFYTNLLGKQYDDLPPTETLTKMGLTALLPDNSGKSKTLDQGTLRDVPKFLNRLLALESTDQNKVFDRFSDMLDGIIDQQIANGTLDTGMENYKALSVDVKEEKTVYTDPKSGAETKYLNLEATQKNKLFPWAKMRFMDNFLGIYKNEKSGKVWAVRKGATRTDERGRVVDTYFLQSPSADRFRTIPEAEFKGDSWQKVGTNDAQATWEKAVADEPETRKESLHIITGAILPVWDRLPKGNARVYRIQTSDNRRFIGRILKERDVDQTLRKFDTERSINYTTAEIQDKILRDNNSVTLANSWQLSRRRVANENRIELTGDNLWKFDDQLKKNGVFSERINWDTRYFIPTGDSFESTFTAVTKDRPVTEVVPPADSRATRLNSGFDPTGGKFDDVDIQELLKPYVNKTREVVPHLVEIGKQVIAEGNSSIRAFGKKMRELLGDLWGNFKGAMNDVYKQAKEAVSNERGSIRISSINFSKQLDDWAAGKLNPRTMIRVSNTPEVITKLGAKQLPIEISQRVVEKIVNKAGVGDGKHGLPLETLKHIPEQIHDPIMVFSSATVQDSLVILTELKDTKGNSVIATIALEKDHGRYIVNAISSVYGKDNSVNFIKRQIAEGRELYRNTEKSRAWFRSREALIASGANTPKRDSINSILQQEKKDVNVKDLLNNERGSISLGRNNSQQQKPKITVEQKADPTRIGALRRTFQSVYRVAEKSPTVKAFVNLAETAMEKQEKLRNHFRHRVNKWEAILKEGNFKENKQQLHSLLFDGDVQEREFTRDELRDMGYNDQVIKAYRMVRESFNYAYKLANEVKQSLETKSKNLTPQEYQDLQNNQFAKILNVKQQTGGYLVSWQSPKTYETVETMPLSQLEALRDDPNAQIINEKAESTASYVLPEHAGYVRGDDWYEVHYRTQTPPVGYREGYMPHFFHSWFIREKIKDENGNASYRTIGSGRTVKEAMKNAEKLQKDYPDAELVIQPKEFQFAEGATQAAVLGDKDYFKMTKKIADELSMSIADAKSLLHDNVKMRNRHRFMGNFLERKGAAGYETNFDWVISHYFNQVSRYVALDPFKSQAISRFERFFGSYSDTDKMSETAKFVKDYIDDVNGKPTAIESFFNDVIKHTPWIGNKISSHYGDRVSLQIVSDLTNFTAALKLGLYSISSALIQGTQWLNIYSEIGNYAVKGAQWATKPNSKQKAILFRTGVDANLSMETSGYSKAGQVQDWFQGTTYLFRRADVWLRRVAALGAYQKGIDEGMNRQEALEYAKNVNRETNFEYGVHDTPNFIRRSGPVGQLLFQFKKYPVKELEFMADLAKNGAWDANMRFWVPFILVSGMWGIPALGLLFSFLKLFDYDAEEKLKKAAMEWAGKDPAKQAIAKTGLYGFFANDYTGGVDISKRAGIGDAIPTQLSDLAGPTLSTIYQVGKELSRGNGIETVKAASPAAGNMLLGAVGETHGDRSRVKTRYEDAHDRIVKSLGFTPTDEALERDTKHVIRTEENDRRERESKAIDKYISNPSKENSDKLQELGISRKRVRQEEKKKDKTDLERTLQGVSKKRRSDYGQFNTSKEN